MVGLFTHCTKSNQLQFTIGNVYWDKKKLSIHWNGENRLSLSTIHALSDINQKKNSRWAGAEGRKMMGNDFQYRQWVQRLGAC